MVFASLFGCRKKGPEHAEDAAAAVGAAASASPAERPPRDPLPDEPVKDLDSTYSCEILHTTQGLIKGCWGKFEAEAFYRQLPGAEGESLTAIRHALIVALDIVRFAEKNGEQVVAEELGEGSYARVFGAGPHLAIKLISDRERPWVHKACVEGALQADRLNIGPRVFGHGTVVQERGGHFRGTALVMERLAPRGESWTKQDTESLLEDVKLFSSIGFHNDVKLDNILRRGGRPTLIDFDLLSEWSVKLAVTSSCIEHDFAPLLEPLEPERRNAFREYYDLFAFTLTLPDGELYRRVLARLEELWSLVEGPVLGPLLETTDKEKLTEVPLEVLARTGLEGVSINVLDLRGNLYAHLTGPVDGRKKRLEECGNLPQLMPSHGIYWP